MPVLAVLSLAGCASEAPGRSPSVPEATIQLPPAFPAAPGRAPVGNVLLFVADDLGVDRMASYGVGQDFPATPTIDGLAAEGVRFTRAWAEPVCSPGRAAIQTGRQPYQTGVGMALSANTVHPLADEEVTIAELLDGHAATAFVGKWHLSSQRLPGDAYYRNPNRQGWDAFAGILVGLDDDIAFDGAPQSYWDWERTYDGVPARSSTYVTTANADDAIAALKRLPEPWVLVVAFVAPHSPLHWPPDELWSGVPVGETTSQRMSNAMIEAMDHEMGRVLDALGPERTGRTTVMFTADNGGEPRTVSAPYDPRHAKGSAYEGGLRVPLIVSGLAVERRGEAVDHLVQATDLFATIAELEGVAADPALDLDSVSFVPSLSDPDAPPPRPIAFAELFGPTGAPPYDFHFVAIRDDRYKLIRTFHHGVEEALFYDLGDDPAEGPDLLAAGLDPDEQRAYDDLDAAIPTPFP